MNYKNNQKSLTSQQWGIKMVKDKVTKIRKYIKYYFEPDAKLLQNEAFESAKQYFAGKQKTMDEFVAYQRGYKNAYRNAYAKKFI